MLNAVYTYASTHPGLYPGSVKDPGVQATKEAVEGAIGLKINYYAMVDMKGFEAWSTPWAGSGSTSTDGSRSAAATPSSTATSRRARTSCSTVARRSGSPGRGPTRPTTTGWRGRSA